MRTSHEMKSVVRYYTSKKKYDKTNIARNTTKSIFAIQALSRATPLNPKKPATIAITKKITAQFNNISASLFIKS